MPPLHPANRMSVGFMLQDKDSPIRVYLNIYPPPPSPKVYKYTYTGGADESDYIGEGGGSAGPLITRWLHLGIEGVGGLKSPKSLLRNNNIMWMLPN